MHSLCKREDLLLEIIDKGNNLNINDLNNYRPISILPAISKIFEKIVYNQVYEYFSKNNWFYKSQYGFRPKHSTEFAVIEFIDRIYKHLDNNANPLAVLCDLSKAFDTLDHSILLSKLKYYGFSEKVINWFTSYLLHRKQYNSFNNVDSSSKWYERKSTSLRTRSIFDLSP